MVSSKGRKAKEKNGSKDKDDQNKKAGNKAFKIGLIVIMLSYSVYVVLDEMGWLEFDSESGSTASASLTLGDTASSASVSGTQNVNNAPVAQESRSSFQAKDVPLVDVQSFDKLSALYLLSERVQTSNKPAAELYGLTRLSIHAKRNQAIETELLAKKSKFELEYQKNQSEIKDIVDGKPVKESSPSQSQQFPPDYPSNSGYPIDMGQDLTQGVPKTDASASLGAEDEDLSKQVYLPTNFVLRGMVNDRASLAIKGKTYDSVRRGQRVLARFEITQFNYELDCVTIKDTVDDSSFITCLN